MSALNINTEELLKELDPATLQALEQLLAEDAPAVRKTIQNIKTAKWKETHKELLTLPFCHIRQQPVRIILYFPLSKTSNELHPYEGCCNVCAKHRIKHEPTYTHPIENRSSLKIINNYWML